VTTRRALAVLLLGATLALARGAAAVSPGETTREAPGTPPRERRDAVHAAAPVRTETAASRTRSVLGECGSRPGRRQPAFGLRCPR
jgi:hypothetical protein